MYILNRKGVLENIRDTDNQCKDVGHELYYYTARIVTKGLDKEGFVTDHLDVQEEYDNVILRGSCEEMCKQLFKATKKLMSGRHFYAYHVTISPIEDRFEGPSFMEFKWAKKHKYLNYL